MLKTKKILTAVLALSFLAGCSAAAPEAGTPELTSEDGPSSEKAAGETSEWVEYWPTDDWRTCHPEAQGMEGEMLDELDDEINDNYPNIHSFLVVRNGYLVFEKYYANQGQVFGPEDAHWLASATKTFTGALIGIALDKGLISGIGQKVVDFFPEDMDAVTDDKVKTIEIRHLLTMMTGFDWDDANIEADNDRVAFALSRPMLREPGTAFNYDSPGSHLLSAIITKTGGMNTLAFAKEYLFKPLGIKKCIWQEDNRGINHGDMLMALRPRDMAKFGYLYLNEGLWDGEQIVPAEWVADSTKMHSAGGSPHYAQYGYQCWVTNDHGYDAFFAGGFGGQFIYVVPDLKIVVAITSDWDRHHEENRFLVGKYVIPAITDLE